jgi:curved DNA-binding protein CbpA
MFKDYYAILTITVSATKAEIKSAYKKQAVKWHPDKNIGVDTTTQMQEINEAYLILNDDDARSRYDREYIRFNKFQEEKKKEEPKQKQHEQKKPEQEKTAEKKSSERKTDKPKEEYATYQFDDELLKKWMENARKQAIRNVHEMVTEFRDSSIIGFGSFFKTALIAIAVGAIFFIIVLILKSI